MVYKFNPFTGTLDQVGDSSSSSASMSKEMVASESLSAGDFVNVWDDGGVAKVRKAGSANQRAAIGFVLDDAAPAAAITVYFMGINTSLSGLSIGEFYFLGGVGAPTLNVTTTAGHYLQRLGMAISTTEIVFDMNTPVVRGP